MQKNVSHETYPGYIRLINSNSVFQRTKQKLKDRKFKLSSYYEAPEGPTAAAYVNYHEGQTPQNG